ncbi:hypothetical protein ACLOJK_031748 [Asimina triloba]
MKKMALFSSSTAAAEMKMMEVVGRVIKGRYFMMYASFLILSTTGATYIFGVYSADIKSSMAYNQQTLNTISFFKDLGSNVGILSGLVHEVSPPSVVLAIGAALNFSGYFLIWLAVTARIPRPQLWQMCLYMFVAANSQSFAGVGALVTCVRNFPEGRGVVVGLLKGVVGLSGAIFTQLYLPFYGTDSKSLILLIAWLPAAVSLLFLYTIRMMEGAGRRPDEVKIFYYYVYVTTALAGYLMLVIIIDKQVAFTAAESRGSACVILFMLFFPLFISIREEVSVSKQLKLKNPSPKNAFAVGISVEKRGEPSSSEAAIAPHPPPLPASSSSQSALPQKRSKISAILDRFKAPERGEDYNILQAATSIDMFVLFFVTICGVGGTLTAIDNMGQIGESLGYDARGISTFVSLVSIWNFGGRVATGLLSESLLSKYKFPRPLVLSMVLLFACVGHLLIAFPAPGSLYVASVIIGFCLGAQWSMTFAIISEIFGLKYYATLFSIGGAVTPIGSYLLNVRVAGRLYDREALKQRAVSGGTSSGDLTCMGEQCYRLSFIIIAAVALVGSMISAILVVRTWKFYKGDIYARFHRESEATTAAASELEMGVARNGGME